MAAIGKVTDFGSSTRPWLAPLFLSTPASTKSTTPISTVVTAKTN